MADQSTGNGITGNRATGNRAAAPASITAALHNGERLLWWGTPRDTYALRSWMLIGMAEGIFLTVLGAAMFVGSLPSGSPNFVWGIAALGGLVRLFVRPLYQLNKRAGSIYALTNQRVMAIIGRGHRPKVRCINLGSLPATELKRHGDGSGTISFRHPPRWGARGGRIPHPLPRLDSIDDADAVYAALTDAFAEFSAPPPNLPPPPSPDGAPPSIIR